jgi:hypothetical protein
MVACRIDIRIVETVFAAKIAILGQFQFQTAITPGNEINGLLFGFWKFIRDILFYIVGIFPEIPEMFFVNRWIHLVEKGIETQFMRLVL